MSPPKPIAANLINIPRILTPVSYRDWLFNLMKTAHNRKALSRLAKEDLDQCFRLQATKQFELDNNNLKDALAQVSLLLPLVDRAKLVLDPRGDRQDCMGQ